MLDTLAFGLALRRLAAVSWKDPAQLAALQQKRWRQLLRHAAAHSPFYRRRLEGLDLDRCQPADVPPLTRAEMMANFDTLVTDPRVRRAGVEEFLATPDNLGKRYLNRYAVCHTSGSQGQPALVVQERRHMLLGVQAQMLRGQALSPLPPLLLFLARLVRPARVAVLRQKPGFSPGEAAFAYLAEAQTILRILPLSVLAPIEETVARLNDFQPDYVTGSTSGLEVLAHEQRQGRLRLRQGGQLRGITNISEPLPPPVRALIEEAFGVRVSDCYALAECLALTSGCPQNSGAHLNADLAMLEVVDKHYRPVPDGFPGDKVLVTNLYNRLQPLIRYEVDDVVTLSRSPCPCGSRMPHIRSVLGRRPCSVPPLAAGVDGTRRPLSSTFSAPPTCALPDASTSSAFPSGARPFAASAPEEWAG